MLVRYDRAWIRNGNRKSSLANAGLSVNEGCCVIWDKAWVGLGIRASSRAKPIGPATRCDATHSRRKVLKPLQCIKIACDALLCISNMLEVLLPMVAYLS